MLHSLPWAVIPPLLLLGYYYRRALAKPPLLHLLLGFGLGTLSGLFALSLEWEFEHLASSLGNWDRITRSLAGAALRQIVEVGPIEEGCKLGGVVLFQYGDRQLSRNRRYRRSRPSTIFLLTIAIALGFTAQENWVYLANDTASASDRLIGTPVHAMFSAPWGYALAIGCWRNRDFSFGQQALASNSGAHLPKAIAASGTGPGEQGRTLFPAPSIFTKMMTFVRSLTNKRWLARAWVNAVICHALANVLSSAWRYSPPLRFLSYGLFPFLLWMFWRLEGLLRRVQSQPPIILISGPTPIHCYWQMGLVLFALMLGGNSLFGFFLLARSLSLLNLDQLFYPHIWWFLVSRFLVNLIPGIIAWVIYQYLRRLANRRYI
jgi:RsiW-degrading membrane proteinase PrsW (M82 family)